MINIAICDDENIFIDDLEDILNVIALKNNFKINISRFNNGKELLDLYKRDIPNFDFIFLDMILKDESGIDLGKEILKIDSLVKFFIVSSSKDYLFEGYEIYAISYILKPLSYKRVEKEFLRGIDAISKFEEVYEINKGGDTFIINLKEVYFFEVNHRKVNLAMNYDYIEFYNKIENIEEELKDRGFKRCHRSYVVNVSKIKAIVKNEIILTNNETIPLGRKYKKELKETFMEFLREL